MRCARAVAVAKAAVVAVAKAAVVDRLTEAAGEEGVLVHGVRRVDLVPGVRRVDLVVGGVPEHLVV